LALGAEKAGPVAVGSLKDFAKDGVFDKFAKSHGFFMIRREGRLYAATSYCTHKRAAQLVSKATTKELACPKHGSTFALSGAVIRGPARQSLPRYAITATDQGRLTVDTSKQFEESKWNDPASYVAIP
jgi:nitrite reductase/ring-hydroxylating ferredoxin subunit